jgi:zinc transport system ATP-binding protein
MSKTLIKVNNISLSSFNKNILDNVSFELKNNDFITLIGPNGAGKSSLIKVILGLISADSGSVTKAKKLKIGYTPQKFIVNQFIPISVINFLTLNKNVSKDILDKTIDITDIKDLLSSSLQELSGGELQRVLLTRSLLNKPDVLILDEPTQNLDINSQKTSHRLIYDIHKNQKCAVLMISHDLHRVMKKSTQVICLYHHICCMGKPVSILKDSQFNKLFADHTDDLMAVYKHHHNGYE